MKTLLLAEDNDSDAYIMQLACRRSGIPHVLQIVNDGEKVIEYLSGKGKFHDRSIYPLPNLIFLDIDMPKQNGHDVLQWIRNNEALRRIPVVMITGSKLDSDIERAYKLGAISYLQKLPELGAFGQAVRVILKYWLELNICPPA